MVIYIYDNHLHTIVSIFQLYFMNSLAFRWSLQPTVLIGSLDSGDQPALIPLCFFALLNTYTAEIGSGFPAKVELQQLSKTDVLAAKTVGPPCFFMFSQHKMVSLAKDVPRILLV